MDANVNFILIDSEVRDWHCTEEWNKYTDLNLRSGSEDDVFVSQQGWNGEAKSGLARVACRVVL